MCRHKPRPIIPEEHRLRMVAALKPVTHAILGDKTDMFRPIREINPALITIGFNQHFDETKLHQQTLGTRSDTRNRPYREIRRRRSLQLSFRCAADH